MNFFLKQKLWFFIAMFFMVVNIVIICTLFCHKHHLGFGRHKKYFSQERAESQRGNFRNDNMRGGRNRNHFQRMNFISEALDFSEEQKEKLKNIYEEIETKKDDLFEKHEELKKMFNEALYSENSNQQYLDSLVKSISLNSESYNRLRIGKANKIKELCTDEQKEKLSTVFNQKNSGNRRRFNRRRE